MTGSLSPAARARLHVVVPLALAAGLAWIALLLGDNGLAVPAICSSALLWSMPTPQSYAFVFAFVSPVKLGLGWLVMIVAMMLPATYELLVHVRESSFRHMRARNIALFLTGYVAVWSLAGGVLIGAALTLRLASVSTALPMLLAAAVVLVWQASPWKQVALNRCHSRPSMAAFAPAAYRDALALGLRHGAWCLASCWALMLLALLVPAHHVLTMAIIGVFIWVERLDKAKSPRWELRVPVRALRLLARVFSGPRRLAGVPEAFQPGGAGK